MPTTPVQGFPYPALSDPANGPVALQNLALAVEGKTIVTCTSSTRPAHLEGRVIYETDTDLVLISDGATWQRFGSRKDPRGLMDSYRAPAQFGPFGDTYMFTAPGTAPVYEANRRVKVTIYISGWVTTPNTGIVFSARRVPVVGGVSGAVQNVDADGRYVVWSTTFSDGFQFSYMDVVPSTSAWQYGIRCQGHLANNSYVGTGSTIWVEDVGAV